MADSPKRHETSEELPFDKEEFMEEQWAKLAAMYGVSVEEVKSKEFDERLNREFEEQRRKDNAIDERENVKMWRGIYIGGIVAGVVVALGWLALSPHRWWFLIPGIITTFLFMSLEEESTKLVKREDYQHNSEKYWERVQSMLTHCQVMSFLTVLVVSLLLILALEWK